MGWSNSKINASTWKTALKAHGKPGRRRKWVLLYCYVTILYDTMRLCGRLA